MFTQCRPGPKGATSATESSYDSVIYAGDSITQDTVSNGIPAQADSFSNISFLLPSPDEILAEILTTKMAFDLTFINPKANAPKYLDTKCRALNLGVYLTDLAYVNYYNDKTEALEYFKIIRNLAQKINIYKIFNEDIYNRIQDNLTNKDSISYISKEVYYNMLDVLESSKRNNIYALVSCGALIEALYLSTISVKQFSEYKPIAQKIFEQKYVLNNFYEFTSQFKKDPDVKTVLILLDNLKRILNDVDVKNTEKNAKMDKKKKLVISGGEEIMVTEKSFVVFKENVVKTRQEIISF